MTEQKFAPEGAAHKHEHKHEHRHDDEHVHGPDCSHEPIAPFVREAPKVGRNEPCPCGSGKKHKKCCGA